MKEEQMKAEEERKETASAQEEEQKPSKRARFFHTVKFLAKRWFITAFGGMAQGLFATLIMGLIVKQVGLLIGEQTAVGSALVLAGKVASVLTGVGIGAGVALSLKAKPLVVFSAAVAGLMGAFASAICGGTLITGADFIVKNASPGDPIGAYLAAVIGTEIGILLTGKTKLDIIVLPFAVISVATAVTFFLCPPVIALMNALGKMIDAATHAAPFFMGIIISVTVGILLTLPTSSAAICISIGLGGLPGGAAVVGCCCQMVGFAVTSFKENGFSGLIAQGLGTSMLQIPNLFRKPIIMLPEIVASAVLGPVSTCLFQLECVAAGSGMGTAGLVGVFSVIEASKDIMSPLMLGVAIALLLFVLPAAISLAVSFFMRRMGWLKDGDMKLQDL